VPAPATDALVVLAARLLEACRERSLTLAAAESCTGGLIGHLLTEVPGVSDLFTGGIVSYSDAAKVGLLDVAASEIAHHGAVSEQVAVAMAEGARRRFNADLAVAVTGIAGPSGGGPGTPVGLTFVAVADAAGHVIRRHVWTGGRSANKLASAEAALELALERVGVSGS
jgi:nicotinamide-nucleotide amidase